MVNCAGTHRLKKREKPYTMLQTREKKVGVFMALFGGLNAFIMLLVSNLKFFSLAKWAAALF